MYRLLSAHANEHAHESGEILEFLLHTLEHTLPIIPFLFLTYLIIEYFEHRATEKLLQRIQSSAKLGPLWGSIAGLFPQCGFSSIASTFYVNRFITFGTLIAIFLATSDEMIPVLLTVDPGLIPPILIIKLGVGIFVGFLIDFIIRSRGKKHPEIQVGAICQQEGCHCDSHEGILKPALHHTLKITVYIFLVSLALTVLLHFIDIGAFLSGRPLIGVFMAALIGFTPNCATSIVITQLYASGSISFGIMTAGLLTNSGVGILVLFRINKNLRENLFILGILLVVAILTGLVIDFFI